ncbi:hypothetical protein D1AOALGA4SA_622 [Olavius algarvensis Delta 1 endosymbiont]|nr:hypothetical protein D1AOALGA4SA_622 [Olavius algarvensis Delta 1 endosymbiont]
MKMKYIIILISCVTLVVFAGLAPVLGSNTQGARGTEANAADPSDKVTWEVPIAAGVYYPSDGPVPDNPVRYYRVRCWPGCHTGSSLGKYPSKTLEDKPIFPTSTVDAHTGMPTPKE